MATVLSTLGRVLPWDINHSSYIRAWYRQWQLPIYIVIKVFLCTLCRSYVHKLLHVNMLYQFLSSFNCFDFLGCSPFKFVNYHMFIVCFPGITTGACFTYSVFKWQNKISHNHFGTKLFTISIFLSHSSEYRSYILLKCISEYGNQRL